MLLVKTHIHTQYLTTHDRNSILIATAVIQNKRVIKKMHPQRYCDGARRSEEQATGLFHFRSTQTLHKLDLLQTRV